LRRNRNLSSDIRRETENKNLKEPAVPTPT
jgi:hypothetical protein